MSNHTTRRYSHGTIEQRFWHYTTVGPFTECWLWHGPTDFDEGYGRLHIGKKYIYSHRLSYQIHHGVIPDGLDILHTCDNRQCVNPCHLYAGTHTDNMADMKARRRYVTPALKGESSPMSKLTEADVLEIRALHQSGTPRKDIAKRFGVNPGTVTKIVLRQRWRHI